MKGTLLAAVVAVLFILHQDVWFWRTAHPLWLGFLPVGLFYHACYSIAAAGAMWLLVKHAWPAHLEQDVDRIEQERRVAPENRK
jgi:hypothetical protein